MERTATVKHHQRIELGTHGLSVRGYDMNGDFVCRLEINGAGVAVWGGTKGRKRLANLNWEQLVERLSQTNGRRRSRRR